MLDAPDSRHARWHHDRVMLHLAGFSGSARPVDGVSSRTSTRVADMACSSIGRLGTGAPLRKTTAAASRAWPSFAGASQHLRCSSTPGASRPSRWGFAYLRKQYGGNRRSGASRPRQETHLATSTQAHMRDDHPASNGRMIRKVSVRGGMPL